MRARGPVGAWLIAAALFIICCAALFALGRPLVRPAAIFLLEQSDIPVRSLQLRSLRLREAEFNRVAIGTGDGPEAASIRAIWTLRGLLDGELDRLVVRQPRLAIEYDGETIRVRGLPTFVPRSGGGRSPIQRIDVIDATFTGVTPLGEIVVTADATFVADVDGLRAERALLRRVVLPLAGGTVSMIDVLYRAGQPLECVLEIDGIDIAVGLELLDVEGLGGSGELDGRLPIRIDVAGVEIAGGKLSANGPGTIRYSGGALPDAAAGDDKSVSERIGLVREALADFRYTSLALGIDRAASGEGTLTVELDGANPAVLEGHPFDINVRFDTNFDKLAAVLFAGYGVAQQLLAIRPQ